MKFKPGDIICFNPIYKDNPYYWWEVITPEEYEKKYPGRKSTLPIKWLLPERHVIFDAGEDIEEAILVKKFQKKEISYDV